jgi:hypothetical protein
MFVALSILCISSVKEAYQGVLGGLGTEDALVHLEKGFALQILTGSLFSEAFRLHPCI